MPSKLPQEERYKKTTTTTTEATGGLAVNISTKAASKNTHEVSSKSMTPEKIDDISIHPMKTLLKHHWNTKREIYSDRKATTNY